MHAYERAVAIDPDVFERTSRAGVQAQLPSPADRARYDYTVAKLYAKMGFSDRSLEYLRKAMEEVIKITRTRIRIQNSRHCARISASRN